MTITFPRDLPEPLRMKSARFEPVYNQVRAPTRGGLVQVANVGVDLWSARYETVPMREAEAEYWRAWLHSLRGGALLFKMWHPMRRHAISYPGGYAGLSRAAGGSFESGTANLLAIGALLDTVTLSTLPQNFALLPGDMLSIPIGASGRSLHRVIEGGTASGIGQLAVTVEPTLPLSVVTGVSVDLAKPWCRGVIDPRSVQGPWSVGRIASISFDALQVF